MSTPFGAETVVYPPWDLTGFTLSSSFSVAGDGASFLHGVDFNNDGTKGYVIDQSTHKVYQYSLSTPYDFSSPSASYESQYDFTAQTNLAGDMAWSRNGLFLYVLSQSGQRVYQYEPTIPFDASTAVYSGTFVALNPLNAGIVNPRGLAISENGDRLYVTNSGSGTNGVYEFILGTNYVVSSASFSYFIPPEGTSTCPGIRFQPGGLYMTYISDAPDNVYLYQLTSAYDLSTATFIQTFATTDPGNFPSGIAWNPDGSSFCTCDFGTNTVYRYVKA